MECNSNVVTHYNIEDMQEFGILEIRRPKNSILAVMS